MATKQEREFAKQESLLISAKKEILAIRKRFEGEQRMKEHWAEKYSESSERYVILNKQFEKLAVLHAQLLLTKGN